MEVTVLDSLDNPIPDAFVQLIFDPTCNGLCICESAVFEGYTNALGVAVLLMTLGGCCESPEAAVLYAVGVPIRMYDLVVSPDITSPSGGGDCVGDLADFSVFGGAYGGGGGCTDFNGDNQTNVADFMVFGGCWGRSCPQAGRGR
jgi:hypothetical protein